MTNYKTLTQEQKENTRRACFAVILAEFPHAFQELHRLQGFDFVKPFELFKHSGGWTVNQVSKAFNLSGGFCFALIRSAKKWRNDKLMVVDISDGINFYDLTDFSLVICKPDRKIIYSGCEWSAIAEAGQLNAMVAEKITVVASKRIETAV